MAKKLRVGILFGGRSGEHEVSLLSAASILKAIDRKKFDVVPIGITKEGHWLGAPQMRTACWRAIRAQWRAVCGPAIRKQRREPSCCTRGFPRSWPGPGARGTARSWRGKAIDVVFPVLHGTFGEDGTIQGLFRTGGHRVCRIGRSGLVGGHGQGRDEATVRAGGSADCQTSHGAARPSGNRRPARPLRRSKPRSSTRCL